MDPHVRHTPYMDEPGGSEDIDRFPVLQEIFTP